MRENKIIDSYSFAAWHGYEATPEDIAQEMTEGIGPLGTSDDEARHTGPVRILSREEIARRYSD